MTALQEFVERSQEAGTHIVVLSGDGLVDGLLICMGVVVAGMASVIWWHRRK